LVITSRPSDCVTTLTLESDVALAALRRAALPNEARPDLVPCCSTVPEDRLVTGGRAPEAAVGAVIAVAARADELVTEGSPADATVGAVTDVAAGVAEEIIVTGGSAAPAIVGAPPEPVTAPPAEAPVTVPGAVMIVAPSLSETLTSPVLVTPGTGAAELMELLTVAIGVRFSGWNGAFSGSLAGADVLPAGAGAAGPSSRTRGCRAAITAAASADEGRAGIEEEDIIGGGTCVPSEPIPGAVAGAVRTVGPESPGVPFPGVRLVVHPMAESAAARVIPSAARPHNWFVFNVLVITASVSSPSFQRSY
jgi:hypothetical protein